MATLTLNFIDQAGENPFVDPQLTQTNPGSSSVNASGYVGQVADSTSNIFLYNGTAEQNQAVQQTCRVSINGFPDMFTSGASPRLFLLYQDANNYVALNTYNNGTNSKQINLDRMVGGVQTGINFISGLADNFFQDGDVLRFEVSWTGADATFTAYHNGIQQGSPITVPNFPLISGRPGWISQRNSVGRNTMAQGITLEGVLSTGPTISAGMPTGIVTPSPTFGFTTDAASGTARIVVDSAANLSGVTAAQVLAGQKANGSAAAHDTGAITVTGTSISSNAITALSSGAYTAAAAQNDGGDSNVLSWTFTVDATGPAFVAGPAVTDITDTGATITGTANEAGTASLLVTLQSASQPSDATFDSSTETASIAADTPFAIPHAGENPGAARTAWVQLKDAMGNRTAASVNFTTLSRSVTLQLIGTAGTLANRNLRAWTRQTISGAAVDGGSAGLNVSTDGNGVLVLTGLNIPAGIGVVTLEDPADTFNSHNYHVVFD